MRRRHAVRATGGVTLTAIPVLRNEGVTLPDGDQVTARPGEWLIARGSQVVDVCSSEQLRSRYEPTEKEGLLLGGPFRTRVEKTLGIGSTETPEMLVTAIERLANLKIGQVWVDFTASQWQQLHHRAGKMGIPVKELVKRLVDKICQDIWTH